MAAPREISSLHPRFRSWFHPTLGILLCVVNSLSCGRRPSDPRLVAAREALAKREIGRAEDLASEMLRDQPDSGEAMDIKGLAIQAKGGDAEPVFREAIRLSPKLPDPRDHLAGFLYQRGRAAEAEKLWQEIPYVAPAYAPAHYNLGSAQQATGQMDQAVAQFREALRIDPSLIPARINLGIALVSLGRFPEAEKELRDAARLAPDDPEVAFNLGAALVSARRTQDGVHELQRSLALRKDFPEAHERLATAYFFDGQLEQAEKEFKEALQIRPAYADAHFGLGVLRSEQGNDEEAIREYEQALQSEPLLASASTNLALLYGKRPAPPARAVNRVAAFEIYRRALLERDFGAAWRILSLRSRAFYLDDPKRFAYAARKGFDDSRARERLGSAAFFLRYLEPPHPDPSSGLPYDPGRMRAVQEGAEGEWKVDFSVLSGQPSPDPLR
jgi:Flp pilus assembly protein TadD